ncbi:MAG: hypothetical protein JNM66_17460 [Bryobacterales bacterium]|nr:hypothetical protein [Bryobacterales bacterium]
MVRDNYYWASRWNVFDCANILRSQFELIDHTLMDGRRRPPHSSPPDLPELINSQDAINKGWRGRDSSIVCDWGWHSSRPRYGRQIAP